MKKNLYFLFTSIIAFSISHYNVCMEAPLREGEPHRAAGQTANYRLTHAAWENGGSIEALVRALNDGADINTTEGSGYGTALHWAARNGREDLVGFLVQRGANIDAVANDFEEATPLYLAVQTGHIGIVKLLLKADANPNAVTRSGDTPLHVAVEKGRKTLVLYLLAAGASTNVIKHQERWSDLITKWYHWVNREDLWRYAITSDDGHWACRSDSSPPLQSAIEAGRWDIASLMSAGSTATEEHTKRIKSLHQELVSHDEISLLLDIPNSAKDRKDRSLALIESAIAELISYLTARSQSLLGLLISNSEEPIRRVLLDAIKLFEQVQKILKTTPDATRALKAAHEVLEKGNNLVSHALQENYKLLMRLTEPPDLYIDLFPNSLRLLFMRYLLQKSSLP